jgi:hypothetical protein
MKDLIEMKVGVIERYGSLTIREQFRLLKLLMIENMR